MTGPDLEWNAPVEPFTILGNIHYVGMDGIGAYLITTEQGHFVLDGGFAQSAPQIIASIDALGFGIHDVRYLLNSHAHYDHAAGLARLQRESGAEMVASRADHLALETGRFPYGPSADVAFPPVRVDRVIEDGDTLTLGAVTLKAHVTAGHTPGCTSWSMDAAGADGTPHRALFHCSATVAGQSLAPPAYPTIVEDFRTTFERVRGIQAERRARQLAGDANAFVDAQALQTFNTRLERAFEAELARQTEAAR